MNAVEIEEAVSALAEAPFDAEEFPYRFLQAFGNKETTIRRLRTRSGNSSDVPGGVLQRGNIHLAVTAPGGVGEALARLRASAKTASAKVKFVLATDGLTVEAEELGTGEVHACDYGKLGDAFGFFLPLAGISTVRQIKNNPIDVKATGRLNRLYVELLKDNPEWGAPERRHDLNQFMTRLIFCFFAEDTGIFLGDDLFTDTVRTMSDAATGNAHEVVGELFRAMNVPTTHEGRPDARHRIAARIPRWADAFPYVNGNLFSGPTECPRLSRIARAYLLRAGELDWRAINPDIFGSMIQAVADDEERGALGMHYTSVPNILKVLNPLFLDDLRAALEAAGESVRKLRALRRRLGAIRVFDPACGSGNFLVIAYKELRAIEAQIVARTGDAARSVIPLTNFHGIEIKDFAAEVARLALLIAEFQCDVRHLDQATARQLVLPLKRTGHIVTGNALRLDWLEVCPPPAATLEEEHDLGGPTGRLALVDNGLGEEVKAETYICGNPPYQGSVKQSENQKRDLEGLYATGVKSWKSLDYVAGWILKSSRYIALCSLARAAFVATKSICQGEQVPIIWPEIYQNDCDIFFARQSFRWSNLASNKAAVTVIAVGISKESSIVQRTLFSYGSDNQDNSKFVSSINPYLLPGSKVVVRPLSRPLDNRDIMIRGNMPNDGGHLVLSDSEASLIVEEMPSAKGFVRDFVGSYEFINGTRRYCLWIEDKDLPAANSVPAIERRISKVRRARVESSGTQANSNAGSPHRFVFAPHRDGMAIVIPRVSSVARPYLPVGVVSGSTIISDRAIVIYDGKLIWLAILASRLHLCWIATVCVRMRMDLSYSNTLGWNTFPVPPLTTDAKAELTRRAEDILLAREAHFPATIADLYDPDTMPENLRAAHEANDETLERIYVGRRFRNDTERLEHLFGLYVKMTSGTGAVTKAKPKRGAGRGAREVSA